MKTRNLLLPVCRLSGCLLIALFLISQSSNAQVSPVNPDPQTPAAKQQLKITGTIRNALGNAMQDATVINLVTKKSILTNAKGFYEIMATQGDSLAFTYVGYNRQTYVVNDRIVFDVALDAVAGTLDDVVVVGYGKQRKISQIGAQATVNVEELKQPIANVSAGLAGRLAGLVAVQRTGEPGHDDADIWIRGIATLNNSSPLILVDGVERSMSNLNYDDIASFSILKDASATAVYGVRGANGVVLITTKRGKPGKPEFVADYLQSVTTFTRLPKLADGITYMNMANEALTTRGDAPKYSDEYIANTKTGADPYLYPNVDWMKTVFKDYGQNRKATLNVNGGAPSAFYYVSLGYYDEDGFIKSDPAQPYHSGVGFSRFNFTSNLTVKATGTTTIELGIQGYYSNGHYPGINAGNQPGDDPANANKVNSIFGSVMDMPPVELPVTYPGDTSSGRNPNGGFRNPYDAATRSGYANQYETQLYTNIRVRQQLNMLVKGLSFTSMYAFDNYSYLGISHAKRQNDYIATGRNPDGSLNLLLTYTGNSSLGYDRFNGGNRRIYTESALNYDTAFGDHRVSGLLLYNQSEFVDAFAGDFTSSIPFRTRGLAGRITYSYNDRYFAEANFGYNGSENFAPKKRYGFFPSFGLGWVVSNEKFFDPLKNAISFLKFRFSSGDVGNSSIGSYRFAYLDQVNTGANGYSFGPSGNGIGGYQISSYAVDLTWETSHKTNVGMEMTLLKATTINVDLFKEHRTGIFLQRGTVPEFVGLTSSPYGNLGIVNNAGIDISLQQNNVVLTRNVKLGLRGSFTYARNKLIQNDQPLQKYPWQNASGQATLAQFGYVAEGLFTDSADILKSPQQTFGEVRPGDIKYKDLNGDGIIDTYDRKVIGNGDVPFLLYGFGFDLTIKNFSIGAFFQGEGKATRMLSGNSIQPFSGDGGEGNAYAIITDRWTPEKPNQNAFYPRLGFGGPKNNNNNQQSTWWLKDVSFLKLRTVQITYDFNKNTFSKLGLKGVQLYLLGQNLLTFSKFKLWDPELNTSNGVRYPQVAVYSVGIHFNF